MRLLHPPYGYEWGESQLDNCDLEQAISKLAALNTYKELRAWLVQEGYLIPHNSEQKIIKTIELLRKSGLTHARIAEELIKMRGHLPERLLQYFMLEEKMENEETWSLDK